MGDRDERTFIMVKPDGVHRGLVPEVMRRFQQKGYQLVGLKMVRASNDLLSKHYEDLKDKSFFPGLVTYMASGPVVCMVWKGTDVVRQARRILGETRPLESNCGTLRGDYCIDVGRNIVHGSDAVQSAEREIKLWFSPSEMCDWTPCCNGWVYE